MKIRSLVLSAFAGVLFLSSTLQAQMSVRWIGSDGWGLGTRYEQLFNQYNLQVLNGTIYKIDTITPFQGMSYAIQLIIRTDNKEETPVILGPAWFLMRQDMNLSMNDKVEVRGARFVLNGKNVMSATEVRASSGGKVLLLRDSDGIPSWCAWRKRK